MEKAFNATKYKNEFSSKNYDAVRLMVQKGEKEFLKSHAAERGESLNAWINRAIKRQLEDEGATLPETSRSED